MSTRVPIMRLLAEGIVVVLSILLAFGIDAWWDAHLGRQEERRTLNALAEEFRTNSEHLQASVAFHNEVRRSANVLLEVIASENTLSHDSISHLLSDLTWWRQTPFQTGAVDAVLLGGNLSVIEDEELRRALADWRRALDEYLLQESQDYSNYSEVWTPFLREEAYLPAIVARVGSYPGDPQHYEPGPTPPVADVGIDHRTLLEDPTFHNVLMQKRLVQDNVLGHTERLSLRLDQIRQMLAAEIEGGEQAGDPLQNVGT